MKGNRTMVVVIVLIMVVIPLSAVALLRHPVFGGKPKGARLERMVQSPNYHDGAFHNQVPTPTMVHDPDSKPIWKQMLHSGPDSLRPDHSLTMVKRDLSQLPAQQDLFVWFGHSSYLISLHGVTFLVDPTFCSGSPVSFINKPFPGTDSYSPEDMPQRIDYLVITHDHYDHLDYQSVRRLRDRIVHVVCPLGVGAHFERWGFSPDQLIELDWMEQSEQPHSLTIHCLPTRHFSGRFLERNNTLWASFMLQTPQGNIYIGGDGGYGPHFKDIAQRFPTIHLAILENGQYNHQWRYIHTMPEQLQQVVSDLSPQHVITVHHSKFALARHPWQEPFVTEHQLHTPSLLLPPLGEVFPLSLI